MNNLNAVELLLVEDNPHDLELTLRALPKANFANCIQVARDGAEALEFVFCEGAYAGRQISVAPKLILLDLKLPKVNGLEVLKAIKADPRTRVIPVVVVTSSQEDPDIETAYTLGANSYVVKPVSSDAFIDAMSKLGMYWLLVNQPPK